MTDPTDEEYEAVRRTASALSLPPTEACNVLAVLVDGAGDRHDAAGLEHALNLARELLLPANYAKVPDSTKPYLHYTVANAANLRGQLDPSRRTWDWESSHYEQEIFHLRAALNTKVLPPHLRVRVTTNLANALDHVGRFVEAIELYGQARALDPNYGMPAANRGQALEAYAACVPDSSHANFLLLAAAKDLRAAILLPVDNSSVTAAAASKLKGIEALIGVWDPVLPDFPLGRSRNEREYREWALARRLFLTPMNDIGTHSIAAHDPLSLVTLPVEKGRGPYLFSFFNTLKQEYVAARYLLYEGSSRQRAHFSDRQVTLTDTLDNSVHGLSIEQVKIAYRMAYSLLDKIAFFLNDYLKLKIEERKVSFHKLWFTDGARRKLRPEFHDRENWPLRGLFWLGKDLHERRSEHRAVLDPDARELAEVRHCLEHRYIKVLAFELGETGMFSDPLARQVQHEDLLRQAEHALKVARTALIQLVCAVAVEERKRSHGKGIYLPMPLPNVRDGLKK